MIAVSQLSKKYKHIVFENINFTIYPGDVYCVRGKPGTGKSTLLNIIAGETKPDSGTVTLNNIPLRPNTNFKNFKIGFADQHTELPALFTGYQFLEFMCKIYHLPKHAAAEKIKTLTQHFFDDPAELNKFPFTYPASTTMKLKIIASLIHDPDILLLDEPFEKINPAAAEKLVAILRKLSNKKSCTTLIAARSLTYVEGIATQVHDLNNPDISV